MERMSSGVARETLMRFGDNDSRSNEVNADVAIHYLADLSSAHKMPLGRLHFVALVGQLADAPATSLWDSPAASHGVDWTARQECLHFRGSVGILRVSTCGLRIPQDKHWRDPAMAIPVAFWVGTSSSGTAARERREHGQPAVQDFTPPTRTRKDTAANAGGHPCALRIPSTSLLAPLAEGTCSRRIPSTSSQGPAWPTTAPANMRPCLGGS